MQVLPRFISVLALGFWLVASPAQAQMRPDTVEGQPGVRFAAYSVVFATLNEEPAMGFYVSNDRQRDGCDGWLWVSASRVRLQALYPQCSIDASVNAVTKIERDDSSIRLTFAKTRVKLQPHGDWTIPRIVDQGLFSMQRTFVDWLGGALKDFDGQAARFLEQLRTDPRIARDAAAVVARAADEYFRRERYLDAETWFTKAIALSPAGRWYWFRAFAKLQRGDRAGAETDLDHWLEFGSPYASYRRELGLLILTRERLKVRDSERLAGGVAEREGNVLVAFRHYQKAFALTLPAFANEPDQRQELTAALVRTWRASQPKPELPEEARRYAVQGLAFAEAKRYEGADAALSKVGEIAPWYPQAFFNRAAVLAAMERYGDAISAMNRYLEIVPDAPDARAARDQIYKWEAMPGGSAPGVKNPGAGDARLSEAGGSVYFFRNWSSSDPYVVHLDGVPIAALRDESYFGARMTAGPHTIELREKSNRRLWSMSLVVQNGADYYLDLTTGGLETKDRMNRIKTLKPLDAKGILDPRVFVP